MVIRAASAALVAPVLAVLVTLLAGASPAPAATPVCRLLPRVEPERVFVGQRIDYTVEILRRDGVTRAEWIAAPIFPSLRAVWLPDGGSAEAPPGWSASSEHRALYAARPGRFAIPSPRLGCQLEGRRFVAQGIATEVVVEPLPAAGRPPDFAGLVGPVSLRVDRARDEVALGGAFALTIGLRGDGNLWVVDDPLPEIPGADVFREPGELSFEISRSGSVQRRFRYSVVPRRRGTLVLPEIELAWFDPASGRYGRTRERARAVVVVAPRTANEPGREAPPADRPGRALRWAGGTAAGLLLAGLAGLVAWRVRRRARLWWEDRRRLSAAAEARRTGETAREAEALDAALRTAIRRRCPDAGSLTTEELRGLDLEPALASALDLLADLERARFDPRGGAPVAARRVRLAVARLR